MDTKTFFFCSNIPISCIKEYRIESLGFYHDIDSMYNWTNYKDKLIKNTEQKY